jgi:hypothetical protein
MSNAPPTATRPDSAEQAPALVLLANDAMRARRRPSAIFGVWMWEAAFGLLLALPFVTLVDALYGRHPRGDAPLWQPGGLPLLDLLVHVQNVRAPLVTEAMLVLTFAVILGLLPNGALLASIAFTTRDLRAPSLRQALARAYPAFAPMALVLACVTAVQLLLGFGAWRLGAWVEDTTYDRLGEARAEQLALLAGALVLAVAGAAGVVQDVARAAIVRFRVTGFHALRLGFGTLRRAPAGLMWSWAWRALAAIVPLAFGSLVAERIGGKAGGALFALAAIHQVVALARVALRASWLARAMRAVDAAHRVLRVPAAAREPAL